MVNITKIPEVTSEVQAPLSDSHLSGISEICKKAACDISKMARNIAFAGVLAIAPVTALAESSNSIDTTGETPMLLASFTQNEQDSLQFLQERGFEVGDKGEDRPNRFDASMEEFSTFTPASQKFIIEAFTVGVQNAEGTKHDGWLAMNLIRYVGEVEMIIHFVQSTDLDIDAEDIKTPNPGRRLRSMLRHFPDLEKRVNPIIQANINSYTEASIQKLQKIVEHKTEELIAERAETAAERAETAAERAETAAERAETVAERAETAAERSETATERVETAQKTEELIAERAETAELQKLNSTIESLYFGTTS